MEAFAVQDGENVGKVFGVEGDLDRAVVAFAGHFYLFVGVADAAAFGGDGQACRRLRWCAGRSGWPSSRATMEARLTAAARSFALDGEWSVSSWLGGDDALVVRELAVDQARDQGRVIAAFFVGEYGTGSGCDESVTTTSPSSSPMMRSQFVHGAGGDNGACAARAFLDGAVAHGQAVRVGGDKLQAESPWNTTRTPVRIARVSSEDVANSVCLMASRSMALSTTKRDSSLTCGSSGNSSAGSPSNL